MLARSDYDKALSVLKRLKDSGFESYFSGHCVKQHISQRPVSRWTICTAATPDRVALLFPKAECTINPNGLSKIYVDNNYCVLVYTFRKATGKTITFTDSFEEDCFRRDFTIDALAFDGTRATYVYHYEAYKDAKNRFLSPIGDFVDRIKINPIIMLRAIRLSAQYNYFLSNKIWEAMALYGELLITAPGELVWDELYKIFSCEFSFQGIQKLMQSGLMNYILPEVAALKDSDEDPLYFKGTTYSYTIQLLKYLDETKVDPITKFTALLSEIGKIRIRQRWTEMDTEYLRITNKGHDIIGSLMARDICQRLKINNSDTERIVSAIRWHEKIHWGNQMSDKELREFIADMQESKTIEILLHIQEASAKLLDYTVLKKIYKEKLQDPKITRLLNGHDLIQLGFAPGLIFKTIFEFLDEKQKDGTVTNRDQAREAVIAQFTSTLLQCKKEKEENWERCSNQSV